VGTDINRNFGYRWGCCGGSSSNPAAITYRGPRAFSTPEARVVRDFVRGRVVDGRQQLRLAISFHSFGEQILYPYGYTTRKLPPDMDRQDRRIIVALAQKMAARNGYRVLHEAQLYITSGTFLDWAYGRHGILSFTYELAPRTTRAGGFYLPQRRIASETRRNRSALLWFTERARCPAAVIGDRCGTAAAGTPTTTTPGTPTTTTPATTTPGGRLAV
jgi:carboxypeptidase T